MHLDVNKIVVFWLNMILAFINFNYNIKGDILEQN